MEKKSYVDLVVSLTPRCQMWYIDEVRELLSESNMCILRASCLGHLVYFGDIQFQGELLKLLCRRLHLSSLEKNSLIFNFGDHVVEFGGADFCVMTGLKFNGDTSLPKQSSFHDTVFRSRKKLIFGDIEKAFREECDISGGNSVLSLKLVYLILIYGMLVFNNQETGVVDLGYLHLMEDLQMFNDFPWGLVAYQCLVSSTHRLKRELSSAVKDMQTNSILAYGFVYALQCWAYEVIPALGTYCASINIEHLNSFPRIRKWIVTRNLVSKDEGLRKFFLAEHGCEPIRVTLSSREIMKLGELGITPSMHVAPPTPLVNIKKNVGRKLDFSSGEGYHSNSKKQTSNRKKSHLGTSPIRSTSAKSIDAAADCSIIGPQNLKRSVPRSNRKRKGACNVSDGTPRSDTFSNNNFVTPEGCTVVGDRKFNDISVLVLSLKGQIKCLEENIELKFKNFEALIMKYTNAVGCSCSRTMANETRDLFVSNVGIGGEDRKKTSRTMDAAATTLPKHDLINWSVAPNKERGTEDGNEDMEELTRIKMNSGSSTFENVLEHSMYDPNESDMLHAELNPFSAWMFDPMREELVMLPIEIYKYADFPWFKTLWRDDGWLDNTHIDALINLLIIKYGKQCSPRNERRWTCLEFCCWEALKRPHLEDVLPILMPYVRGERPLSGGLKWFEADHLFGVANIQNNHWVFYDVSLEKQSITVYNSLNQKWEVILAHFAYVRRNLPILCGMGGLWSSSTRPRSPLKDYWDVVDYSRAPKQVNLSDCGIMALKFMECCVYNVPVTKIIPKHCKQSQQRYCARLFELGQELMLNAVE